MANDVYEYKIFWQIGPQFGMNVLHFRDQLTGSTSPDSDATELLTAFHTDIEPALLDCVCFDTQLIGYKARRINNGGGPTVVSPQHGTPGGRPAAMSTTAVGPCIVWGYHGLTRWFSGRTFIPSVAEVDCDNNVFGVGLIANLDTLIGLLLQVIVFTTAHGGAWDFGIWSRTHLTYSGAETGVTSGKPGIQNRRMKPSF